MSGDNYHHGNLQLALIETGIALINKEGLGGFSLRKVAALCNVSHAAPYAHFKDKNQLQKAMREYVASKFTKLFEDILLNNDKNHPSIIDKLGIAYVSFFIDNPEYFNFLFAQGDIKINLSISDTAKDSFPAFQIFKDTATAIYKSLRLPDSQIENIIIIKWSVVHGLASIATMDGATYDKDWKSQIAELLCI